MGGAIPFPFLILELTGACHRVLQRQALLMRVPHEPEHLDILPLQLREHRRKFAFRPRCVVQVCDGLGPEWNIGQVVVLGSRAYQTMGFWRQALW